MGKIVIHSFCVNVCELTFRIEPTLYVSIANFNLIGSIVAGSKVRPVASVCKTASRVI